MLCLGLVLLFFGCLLFFFFFKQKTAYEMRISDWSSDVCSSDLADFRCLAHAPRAGQVLPGLRRRIGVVVRLEADRNEAAIALRQAVARVEVRRERFAV